MGGWEGEWRRWRVGQGQAVKEILFKASSSKATASAAACPTCLPADYSMSDVERRCEEEQRDKAARRSTSRLPEPRWPHVG